jgi:hypothetical protein
MSDKKPIGAIIIFWIQIPFIIYGIYILIRPTSEADKRLFRIEKELSQYNKKIKFKRTETYGLDVWTKKKHTLDYKITILKPNINFCEIKKLIWLFKEKDKNDTSLTRDGIETNIGDIRFIVYLGEERDKGRAGFQYLNESDYRLKWIKGEGFYRFDPNRKKLIKMEKFLCDKQ